MMRITEHKYLGRRRLDIECLDDYGLFTGCPFHSFTKSLERGRLSCCVDDSIV